MSKLSSHLKFLTSVLSLLIVVIVALPMTVKASTPPPAQGVKITPIGDPVWKPVDFHLFSAPIGTADTGYAEFFETMMALMPGPKHSTHPALGISPGAPHPPPYDSELAEGVAAQGFHEGVQFSTEEFSNGMGVWLVWMNVPAPGVTGSSPDFDSGAIIPNSLFPIHDQGDDYHNGKFFSFSSAFDVPALDDQIDPPFYVDGHSHFPIFFADNADFGPVGEKLNGSYRYVITLTDVTGNGWQIEAHFTVAP